MEGKMDRSSEGKEGEGREGGRERRRQLSLFLHTSAAGGQRCVEATASQLPNSLSNLLVGFELQHPPPPYRGWILCHCCGQSDRRCSHSCTSLKKWLGRGV